MSSWPSRTLLRLSMASHKWQWSPFSTVCATHRLSKSHLTCNRLRHLPSRHSLLRLQLHDSSIPVSRRTSSNLGCNRVLHRSYTRRQVQRPLLDRHHLRTDWHHGICHTSELPKCFSRRAVLRNFSHLHGLLFVHRYEHYFSQHEPGTRWEARS